MSADPDFFIEKKLSKTAQGLSLFDPAALAEYKRYMRNPATVHAMCEDYRACAGIDFKMDTVDFDAGRKIDCPVLLLWGATGGVGRNTRPSPGEVWQRYAGDIRGARRCRAATICPKRRRNKPIASCANFSSMENCEVNVRALPIGTAVPRRGDRRRRRPAETVIIDYSSLPGTVRSRGER